MDAVAELVAQLRRDPMRMALTLFGVVLGTASVVFIASLLEAAGSALSRMNQQASGQDITRITGLGDSPASAQTGRPLRENDVAPMAAATQSDKSDASSGTRQMSQEAVAGKHKMYVGVQSGGGQWADIARLELAHGRAVLPMDEASAVCVLGSDVHQQLFDGVWPLPEDARLKLNNDVSIRPIGVYKPRPPLGGGGGDGTWRFDRRIYVSNSLFKRSVQDYSNGVQEIVIRHRPTMSSLAPDLPSIARRLTPILARLHQGANNFQFQALNKERTNDLMIVSVLAAILLACGAVALIVGGVNVTNAQLVNVVEKTKELAIRRALGASSRDIALSILSETMSLTLLGGVLGIGFGLLGSLAISSALNAFLTEWPFIIVPWSCAVALGAAVVVGLIAGFFPARRASTLPVSECLRDAA